jgi:hypothetical protein
VLDALVDRKDREVTGAGQTAGVDDRPEVAQDGRGPVRVDEDPVEMVWSGKDEVLCPESLRDMPEEGVRFVTEKLFEVHGERA